MPRNQKGKVATKKIFFPLLVVIGLVAAAVLLGMLQKTLHRELYDTANSQMLEILASQRALVQVRLAETNARPGALALSADQVARQIHCDATNEFLGVRYNYLMLVVDKSGDILAAIGNQALYAKESTLAGYLAGAKFSRKEDRQMLLDSMEVNLSGSLPYRQGRTKLLLAYTPMGMSDWYLVNVVPAGFVEADLGKLTQAMYNFTLLLVLMAALIVGYLLRDNRDKLEVLNQQGREIRACAARYDLLSAQSQDVIIEYDLRKGLVEHWENLEMLSMPELRGRGFLQALIERGMIHPADTGMLHEANRRVSAGQESELDLRAKLMTESYNWYHLSMVCVRDDSGRPWRVLARASNIDKQKRDRERLHQKAQQDPLTKLYNKEATREAIDDLLGGEPDSTHALMILDIDNFKHYNDTYGHVFGDNLLTLVAGQLGLLFRDTDVVGRVGGDEFIIFCTNIGSVANAASRATEVCGLFHTLGQQCAYPVAVTCSMGVAMAPQDGSSFGRLYNLADRALYHIKRKEKDNFAFYDTEIMGQEDAV